MAPQYGSASQPTPTNYSYPAAQPAFAGHPAQAPQMETGFSAWVKRHKFLAFGCFTPIALVVVVSIIVVFASLNDGAGSPPPAPSPTSTAPSAVEQTPDPSPEPPPTVPAAVEQNITGTWTAVQDGLVFELALGDNGEFYAMTYDPDDIEELALTYVRVLEGTYEITGADIYFTPLWLVLFDYDTYEIAPSEESDRMTSSIHVRGNAFTMTDPDGTELTFAKTTPSIWEFGYRERMAGGYPVYMRKATLGQFQILRLDNPTSQLGWATSGVVIDDLASPFTMRDFTRRYLVLEFGKEPDGDFQFAWIDWADLDSWTQTDNLKAQGTTLVIDMTRINGYEQYVLCADMLIYVCYYDDSWDDLPLIDAYFAESPSPSG
jgi:hypothetical protein